MQQTSFFRFDCQTPKKKQNFNEHKRKKSIMRKPQGKLNMVGKLNKFTFSRQVDLYKSSDVTQ